MESIISSISGSLISWSDSAIYNNISKPIFTWLGSLINVFFDLWPVFLVVVMFSLFVGFLIGIGGKTKNKKNKSLENK